MLAALILTKLQPVTDPICLLINVDYTFFSLERPQSKTSAFFVFDNLNWNIFLYTTNYFTSAFLFKKSTSIIYLVILGSLKNALNFDKIHIG